MQRLIAHDPTACFPIFLAWTTFAVFLSVMLSIFATSKKTLCAKFVVFPTFICTSRFISFSCLFLRVPAAGGSRVEQVLVLLVSRFLTDREHTCERQSRQEPRTSSVSSFPTHRCLFIGLFPSVFLCIHVSLHRERARTSFIFSLFLPYTQVSIHKFLLKCDFIHTVVFP